MRFKGAPIWIDRTVRSAPTVCLVGRDDKGALFALCRLIRLLYLAPKHIHLADDVQIATAPDRAIRAHQIIRSTQSKDGFVDWRDAAQEQQYARDLILFGTNGFEARSPRDIDDYLEELGIDLFLVVSCQHLIDHNNLEKSQIK